MSGYSTVVSKWKLVVKYCTAGHHHNISEGDENVLTTVWQDKEKHQHSNNCVEMPLCNWMTGTISSPSAWRPRALYWSCISNPSGFRTTQ
jgi:hypothetical protein